LTGTKGLPAIAAPNRASGSAGEFSSMRTTLSPGASANGVAATARHLAEVREGQPPVERADGGAVTESVSRHLDDHAEVHREISPTMGAAWRI
jgi:hypothetical protein